MADALTLDRLYGWIDRRATMRHYPFVLGFVLMLASLTLVIPHFTTFNADSEAWQTVTLKSQDLTHSLDHIDPFNFLAKKVFRLTVPVIMRITHLPPIGVLALQFLMGYLLIVFSYKLAHRILKDAVTATFITAGIVFLYFGRAAFYDISWSWFDGFAYCFLILAMYYRQVLLIFLFAFAAAWTDERALIALALVLFFHQVSDLARGQFGLGQIMRPNRRGLAVLAAMGAYLGLRLLLTAQYGMHTPSTGANLSILAKTMPYLTLGSWTFLEGFWLMFLLTLLVAVRSKDYFFGFVTLMAAIVFVVVSGCVMDITRSGAYLVPVIFAFAAYLSHQLKAENLRLLAAVCFAACLLSPALIVCAEWSLEISVQYSVFALLLRHFFSFFVQKNVLN
jgi:hypothetical protein